MHRYDIQLENNKKDVLHILMSGIEPGSRVLEFGCGNGRMTKMMRDKKCRVTVVEKDPALYALASGYATSGLCEDIMEFGWKKFKPRSFDYIVFADVLEHLEDPETVLKECRQYLKKDGKIMVSIPNFAHNDILIQLYHNRLDYSETGIMDKSHLRVFTYKSVLHLFRDAGYIPVYENCVSVSTGCTEQLLMEEYEIDDFLRSLDQRELKEVYQFVFYLAPVEEDSPQTCVSLIEKNQDYMERRVFFDRGNGYRDEDQIIFYARKSDKCFSVRVQVEEDVQVVRFDPVQKLPCKVKNLLVLSNRGYLCATSNGETDQNEIVFPVFQPSIYITDLESVEWLLITGEIEYSYEYRQKSELSKKKRELTKEREENKSLKNQILEKDQILAAAVLEKEELTKVIEKSRQEKDDANRQHQDMRELLRQTNDQLESMAEELTSRQEALKEMQAGNEELNRQMTQLQEEKEQIRREEEEILEQKDAIQREKDQIIDEKDLLQAEKDRILEEAEQVRREMAGKQQELDAAGQELQGLALTIEELHHKLDEKAAELEENALRWTAARKEKEQLESAILLGKSQLDETCRGLEEQKKETDRIAGLLEESENQTRRLESRLMLQAKHQAEMKALYDASVQELRVQRELDQKEKSQIGKEYQDALILLESERNKNTALCADLLKNQESSNILSEKVDLLTRQLEDALRVSNQRDDNISHLQRVIAEKDREAKSREWQLLQQKQLIDEYRFSTSWKVTRPFRAIMQKIRGNRSYSQTAYPALEDGQTRTAAALEGDGKAELMSSDPDLWDWDIPRENYHPLVTVIVPNYNHEKYLRQRLDSVYGQTYRNFEVLLLDDCSSDGSRDILLEYKNRYPDVTECIFNDKNSGHVISQWNKGIAAAKGDLIWIAESDDYCDKDFLENMVPLLARESVMLAFARSIFVRDGEQVWSTQEYLSDLPGFYWNRPFTMSAHKIVERAFSIKNIIPNVSSAIFRNTQIEEEELQTVFRSLKLSADWVFYLSLIRGGCISYTNRTTNYYRVHNGSTSLKIQQSLDYYREYELVSKYVQRYYQVPEDHYKTIVRNLKEHYRAIHKCEDADVVDSVYRVDEILQEKRKMHILMTCFSLQSGGGETFAIHLANAMRKAGLIVSMLDFQMGEYKESIRSLIRRDIPLISIRSMDNFSQILQQLGGDIIHTHHASVDMAVASWLSNELLNVKQVITLHGMYDVMDPDIFKRTLAVVDPVCSQYIYIADKNLVPFQTYGYYREERFLKLPNGLPDIKPDTLSRSNFGITRKDFVLVTASRGIPEKGWEEAIQAVSAANKKCSRKIHLIILGDGEMREKLEKNSPDYVHFEGTVANVRDYYKMADAGLVPTRFLGESYPLVIIECLQSGTPVIATDIAEVKNQLTAKDGSLAGILLHLTNGKLDVQEIAEAIIKMATNDKYYQKMKRRCAGAAEKFDMDKVCGQYIQVYEKVTKNQ